LRTEENNENTNSTRSEIISDKDNLKENSSSLLNGNAKNGDESGLDVDSDTIKSKAQINLDLLLDVQVDLEVELGRKRVPLEQVLELETGSVLTLNKTADDPVDLYINGTLIANGMLITIDEEDTLGFQIVNIVDRTKRIKSLR